ncbi:SH22A protein, partial [Atlantisia rogersi]|nr:SH22A protein [Atlantisia rogersi]
LGGVMVPPPREAVLSSPPFFSLPGTGDPMDEDRPLFSTFKPLGENSRTSAKPGPAPSPTQPQGAEQPPGHHSRVGQGPAEGPWTLSPSLQARTGSWPWLPGWSPLEWDPQPELVALRARTMLWFEQTQAKRLEAEGELPTWFHGFISRRETEQLLQDQPLGCFLVRFSESTVGFVLSYRGRERCRHYVLDQLPDGRYVILGERSAHPELSDLLRHYATAPIAPYDEFLTVPRGRVRTQPKKGSDSCPTEHRGCGGGGCAPSISAAPKSKPGWHRDHRVLVPAGSAPRTLPHPSCPSSRCRKMSPKKGCGAELALEDPIPFYAMGRGSSPSPEENVYSEV